MKIKMIGIDHTNAGVEVREKFSFTKAGAQQALVRLNNYENVSGCVLVSTCNRMEIWASFQDEEPDLTGFLAVEKNVDIETVENLVTKRDDEAAIRHLFYLTGGLESLILGDDQILTQMKDALNFARDMDSTDSYMEVLFRMAVTAGKKVRNEVNFDRGNRSAAVLSVEYLRQLGMSFENKKCLVIGNGEMGKLSATNLREAGADVTVTVRQYRSGIVCIPQGCDRINYGERYEFIPDCDYIFSATSSPNMTITKERLENVNLKPEVVFVDLAVPRDIDPAVANRKGVKLYDIDALKINKISEQMELQLKQARHILEQEINVFLSEQSGRAQLKNIQDMGVYWGEEVAWRLGRKVKKLSCSDEDKSMVYELVKSTSDKVLQKYLFALQKGLPPEDFSKCMEILKDVLKK